MLNKPIITIYITNYNYGKYLGKAIESAINQTYKKIYIVIVDDASTDISKKILKKYEKYNFIKIIYNKKRKGLVKSSNAAIRVSKGKFILRLDADDYLHPDALNKMYFKIKKNSNAALIFPDYYWVDKKSKVMSRFKYKHKTNYTLKDLPAHGACSLINKKVLTKIGCYNEKFDRQDGYYIWFLILFNQFKIMHCAEPLFYYRKHGKNLSSSVKKILSTRLSILRYFLGKNFEFNSILLFHKKNTIYKLNRYSSKLRKL